MAIEHELQELSARTATRLDTTSFATSVSARNVWHWLMLLVAVPPCVGLATCMKLSLVFLPFTLLSALIPAWLLYSMATGRRWQVRVSAQQIEWDDSYLRKAPRRSVRPQSIRRILVERYDYADLLTRLLVPDQVGVTLQLRDGSMETMPSWLCSDIMARRLRNTRPASLAFWRGFREHRSGA